MACQLEDKRKTQAEICKVTGLTEVTLRKVYKELLENWDDLLPSNYTPAVPPERAFPTTVIASGRSSAPKVDAFEGTSLDKDKETKPNIIPIEISDMGHPSRVKEDSESKFVSRGMYNPVTNRSTTLCQPQPAKGTSVASTAGKKSQSDNQGMDIVKEHSNS